MNDQERQDREEAGGLEGERSREIVDRALVYAQWLVVLNRQGGQEHLMFECEGIPEIEDDQRHRRASSSAERWAVGSPS